MRTLTLILIILLSSCLKKRDPMKHEKGIVVEKQYSPEFNGSGTSFNTNGSIGVHEIHDAEKFIVVFKCEHGNVFSINKSHVYGKVNKGDTVTIDYYEMVNSDGKVKDFDFIDAN